MSKEEEWMPLASAYDHVLGIRRLPERAHHELLDKLRSNELGARAKMMRLGLSFSEMSESIDRPMSSYLFQAGQIDFASSSLTKPAAAGSRNPWTLHAVEATQIEVLLHEVLKLWPKETTKVANKGGRPEEHNWPGALAYCGWWVARHGLPDKKARLAELIIEWFEREDGGAPKDEKEIRTRASRAYDELAKWVNGENGV
ncbi:MULTISPECIES: hypothetical protein [unclassified Methylobacterium]|uniref:hypothetical protein n=1 Tax=unclassified Methylobacterium TaxID=2615210 RepID=UPI0011C1E52F|nr:MULTISPECIES: hypothetical protein [unclassified Methylobacterium]QEE40843.1 hypothetical protein FVA80_19525 [Methylobacterium sp. WL1]TXN53830.1 hypothetical protein FV241_26540 [Methylobacterium sp. WL2]